MSELETFVTDFNSDLYGRSTGADGSAPDFRENVFTEKILEELSDSGAIEDDVLCHHEGVFERGKCKVNGYAIADEENRVDLFTSIFEDGDGLSRVSGEDIRRAAEQAIRFWRGASGSLHKNLEPATDAHSMATRIHDFAPTAETVRIFILVHGLAGLKESKIPRQKVGNVEIRIEIWDMERLSRLLGVGGRKEIHIDLEQMCSGPLPCLAAPPEADYEAFVLLLPGRLVFDLYDDYGSQLLERNVRSFLQAKGKVNRGISSTIRNEPGRFLAYNNGLSMTADAVETTVLSDGRTALKRIKGLQIVNGGQTTASIFQTGKREKEAVARLNVQAKLTVVREGVIDELAPKIAAFANTQNPVQMADFSANDPFHIAIERLANTTWIPGAQGRWFYERTRGQYAVAMNKEGNTAARLREFKARTPKTRMFNKLDLAKYINGWDLLPFMVAFGGQKNFVHMMQRQKDLRRAEPDDAGFREIIAKAIIFREIMAIVKQQDIPGYKSQIVAYTYSYLALQAQGAFDLEVVWQNQDISNSLREMIRVWVHPIADELISTSGTRDVGEWAKKKECWEAISKLSLPVSDPLPPEFQKSFKEGGRWGEEATLRTVALDPDELDAVRECRRLGPSDWLEIIKWADESGRLDRRQREIAGEMAVNSAGNWTKNLSATKARDGRAIVRLARENGVGEEMVV